jgi:protein-S-isoprenylcysteine O-methyltransferase Ste14
MAPQLTHGMPVDFSADVPIFPPAATALCALLGVLLWKLTGARLRVLPAPLAGLSFRLAVTAAVAAVSVAVLSRAGNSLKDAGSGTLFTPVGGMATDGPYSFTRNPMYSGLVFGVMPGTAALADSAWMLLMAAPLFLYLHLVVIPAEEGLLSEEFGDVSTMIVPAATNATHAATALPLTSAGGRQRTRVAAPG